MTKVKLANEIDKLFKDNNIELNKFNRDNLDLKLELILSLLKDRKSTISKEEQEERKYIGSQSTASNMLEGIAPAESGEMGYISSELWEEGKISMQERKIITNKYWGLS